MSNTAPGGLNQQTWMSMLLAKGLINVHDVSVFLNILHITYARHQNGQKYNWTILNPGADPPL